MESPTENLGEIRIPKTPRMALELKLLVWMKMCSDSERLRSRGNYSESLLEQQEIPSHLAVPLHLRARNLTGTDESLVRSGLTGHAWPTHQPSWADFDTRAQDGGPGPSGQKMCGADGFGRLVGHLPLW